jgi:TetR/AcrR family transcriptional regulator, cholesterol catabolism regulator
VPQARRKPKPRASSRNKRVEILASATEYFAREGFQDSKWADVATAVGVGSTALYHYFESKLHCLYEIMAEALEHDHAKFERITAEHEDFAEAFEAVLNAIYDLTDLEVMRNRVLVSEQSLVALHRTSPREEEARQLARERTRNLEFAWATFLTRGMEQGAIPKTDARLLTRAVLGLYNSVWHWYRPRGDLRLEDVRDFYVGRCLALVGLTPQAGAATPRKRVSAA